MVQCVQLELVDWFVFLLPPFPHFDCQVASHAQAQDGQEEVEFGPDAQLGRRHEGNDEAQGLPEAVVAEGRLFVVTKDVPINGCQFKDKYK